MTKTLTIAPNEILGKLSFLVDLNKSIKRPAGDTTVIKTEHGWLFPEDITLHSDKDEWLYAFGATHVWRVADAESGEWELVR